MAGKRRWGTWLSRNAGYLVFVVVAAGWLALLGSSVPPILLLFVILAFSVLQTGYFFFEVPLWCGARNRNGTLCRNNTRGLLWGCHLREHKWQRLKMVVVRDQWRTLYADLFSTPHQGLAAIGGVVGIISGLTSTITLLAKL
jgi:hypothetical protein